MAKKQSRRSVSLNRRDYEAVKQEASRRGTTIAGLVEAGLAAIGVPVGAHPRQSLDLARANAARRAASVAARLRERRLPSRERQLLGDVAADAHGFA